MAYRTRQQVGRVDVPSTYNYGSLPPQGPPVDASPEMYSSSSASSLAAKAIRASSAYRDSSLSSLYEQSALSSPHTSATSSAKDSCVDEHSPKKNAHESSRRGFWGVLARKAKSILEEDNIMDNSHERLGSPARQTVDGSKKDQPEGSYTTPGSYKKTDTSGFRKGFDAITSSLGYISNALEEGITAVENRTADIIQETRKMQIRKKGGVTSQNEDSHIHISRQPMMQTLGQPRVHTDLETQLKASRDVSMAMAAKAKLLLRELKTVKADLAFAKERCAQLEEENRILRESREKGDNPEDDDLIRLQLESLLAEKARLAQENSVYARENRFLREIVEYHQLTMQDVVYLDEGCEEVTEVSPIRVPSAVGMQSFVAWPPTPTPPLGAAIHVPFDLAASEAVQRPADGVKNRTKG